MLCNDARIDVRYVFSDTDVAQLFSRRTVESSDTTCSPKGIGTRMIVKDVTHCKAFHFALQVESSSCVNGARRQVRDCRALCILPAVRRNACSKSIIAKHFQKCQAVSMAPGGQVRDRAILF